MESEAFEKADRSNAYELEADDRDISRRPLAMDDPVVHHEELLALPLVRHRAGLRVVDEVDALLAQIGDKNPAELTVRQPLADLDEQPVVNLAESAFLNDQRQEIGPRGGDKLPASFARIGVHAIVDGKRKDTGGKGEQQDWPNHRGARGAGRVDHDQLRIAIHHAQRLRDGDHQGERHHDRNDRRQDQRGDLEERQRRLAIVGDEVDPRQNLRRPNDRKRPEQRGDEELYCPPQYVAFEDIHRYGVVLLGERDCRRLPEG